MTDARQQPMGSRNEEAARRPLARTDGWPDPVVRVLIVDDGELARRGLRHNIARQGLDVVGEAAAGDDAIRMAKALTPTVAVVRLGALSKSRGRALIAALAESAEVLVLGGSLGEDELAPWIEAGACGCVSRDATPDVLAASIVAAAKGSLLVLPRATAPGITRRSARAEDAGRHTAARKRRLSGRELEVLRLLGEGKENTAIADALFISTSTVKKHVSTILEKLGVRNRVQAAVRAARWGLLDR
jgi:DNA-binding NarL/FixJ family response regulator